ncbi:MAG TPA: hypothetical protein VGR07_23525, partial [Thermoanaerobaculia bacterium]|nr:hypothetical protein [Thermoanaerobaculia bacterium]
TDPGDPGAVFAGTTNGVYASADSGATWLAGDFHGEVVEVAAEHGPRRRLMASVTTGDPRFLKTHLYVSSDRGRTWRRRDGLGTQPLRLLLADPTTPGAFYAVAYFGELFRTTDAGLHWTSLGVLPRGGAEFPGSSVALALDPVRPGFGFVAVDGSRFGRTVWKTASFGAVWTPFFRGIFASDFQAVTPDPAHPETLWAGAGAAGGSGSGISPFGLWKSPDRGATWAQAAFPTSLVSAILFAGTSHSLFAVVDGALLRSEDGGGHWTPNGLDNVADLATPPEEPATLYALARRGTVFGLNLSLDGGITWTTRATTASTLAVAPGAPATLYANASPRVIGPGNPNALRRSTDRGATWTTILAVNGGFLGSIGLDPADSRRIAVSFEHQDAAGLPVTDLLWTADGGATWNQGDLSPQPYRVFTLLPDPLVTHGFLAGTGADAFASADGGATWTRLGEGLPRARTHLSLDPGSPRTLYAATEGGGIYRLERTTP